MTFLELKNLAAFLLDDPNFEYYSSASLGVVINNAYKEVQKMIVAAGQDYYVECVETDTVVDQEIYTFPTKFLKINNLRLVTSGTGVNQKFQNLKEIVRSDIQNIAPTGTPAFYYLDSDYLHLRPIPNVVKTIIMDYTRLVSDMEDDADEPDCPEQYQELIAVLAALDGLIKDNRNAANLERKRQFYEALMKKDVQQRKVDQPRMSNFNRW